MKAQRPLGDDSPKGRGFSLQTLAGDSHGSPPLPCATGHRGERTADGESRQGESEDRAASAEMWTMDHRRWSIAGEPSEPQGSREPRGEQQEPNDGRGARGQGGIAECGVRNAEWGELKESRKQIRGERGGPNDGRGARERGESGRGREAKGDRGTRTAGGGFGSGCGLELHPQGRQRGNAEHCTGDERRRTVGGRTSPGPECLRNASRKLSPMLAARQRQLEEGPGSSRQPIRTARQEIHLAALTAGPSLDPSQPDANPFPFELLSDLAAPKAASALGTRLLCQFDHRLCPRLDGVTHHV